MPAASIRGYDWSKDPWRNAALAQAAAGSRVARAQAEQSQIRTIGDRMQNNRSSMINALLGGGMAEVQDPMRAEWVLGQRNKKVDPTAQFGRLLGMVDGTDQDSVDINSGGAGAGPGDWEALYSKLSNKMDERGGSYAADIQETADNASKAAAARMAARGLGGSTLVDSMQARVVKDRNSAMNKLNDTLLGHDINTLQNVGIAGLQSAQRAREFNASMRFNQGNRGLQLLSMLLGL